jgi:hypothetical protein
MAHLVPDDLWAALAPLLSPAPAKPKGGWPCVPDRVALAGILFVPPKTVSRHSRGFAGLGDQV